MASWTNPVTHNVGDVFAVSDWNGLCNDATFLYQAPYVLAYDSGGTTLSTGAFTQVNLASTVASGYGMSLSSNNVVVPLAGIYHVSWTVTTTGYGGAGQDQFVTGVYQNATAKIQGGILSTATTSSLASSGSGLLICAVNDTIGLYADQNTGGTLSTNNVATDTFLHIFFVGSA